MRATKDLYPRLLRYAAPYWKGLAVTIFCLILLGLSEPLFPALMQPLLDEGFANKNPAYIIWTPVMIIGLFLFRALISFLSSYASAWVSNHVVADMRAELFARLIYLPTHFFDQTSSGALTSKIAYDVNNVAGAATNVLTTIVRDSVTLLGLLGWLMWIDWQLTMITLAMAPATIYIVKYFSKRIRFVSSKQQKSMASITKAIEESSIGHKVLKMFDGFRQEIEKFTNLNQSQRQLNMRSTVAFSAVVPLSQLVASFAIAAIVFISLNPEFGNEMSAGTFVSFLTAMLMLLAPLKRLTGVTASLQKGLAAAESVFEILDEETEADRKQLVPIESFESLNFERVGFRYQSAEKQVLKDVSFSVNKGEVVAFVGQSGSGKTTISSLINRFYLNYTGSITLNNVDFKDLSNHEVRKMISWVSQDVRLFDFSIMENVAFGALVIDQEKVKAALKAANALEFVEKMPNGLSTIIGQNGVRLSGGQRQRIAIARAFYKDSELLLLDEATSALDTQSEKEIQIALDRLMKDKTTIVIAHRLSTVINATKILVMNEGQIEECGTHQELIDKSVLYKKLFNTQFVNHKS